MAGCAVVAAMTSYVLAQTQIDLRTQAKSVDFSNAGSTKPSKTGTVLPATCTVGETFLKTDAAPGANLYVCTAVNVWTVQGSSLPEYTPGSYGKVLTNDDGGMGWESLGGDVSGAPDGLTVTKIQGRPIAPNAPASGHLLSWDGTQWIPQAFQMPALSGDITTSSGSTVTALTVVNPAPGSCGDATHVCQVTTNAKGLVMQQTPVALSMPGGGINSLNGLTGTNQSFASDTNVTLTSAGTTHTLGWSGLLGLSRGGLNADLSTTGGAHQVLKQTSVGAPVTVGLLTASDVSALAASATTDTTNAANITSGILPNARLAAVPNSALANSSVTVSAGNGLSGGGATALGGSVTLSSVLPINAQSGTSYTVAAADGAKLVTFNNAAATSVTLPQAIGSFGAGWYVRVRNLGGAAVTITPTTSSIDGASSLALQTGQGVVIASDGTNYQTWKGFIWQPSAAASHQFATGISAAGVVSYAQPVAADINGLAASATTDTTNAANITSGTLSTGRLPQFAGGDVTSAAAGSAVLSIGTGRVTNSMLAGSIDATAKLSGIVPAPNGGTGSGYTAFAGPAGSVKTYTLPNQSATIVTTADTGSVTNTMLAGSIATTKLSSRQGNDTNVMTAGTVSGTGNPLCVDANGGATTTGCSTGAGTVTVVGSGNLSNTALVTGGGTQALQTPAATATMDSSGNIQTPGTVQAGYGSSNAGAWAFIAGPATSPPASSVGFQAPASVTSAYRITLPGAPAAGFVRRTNATPSVESVAVLSQADLPSGLDRLVVSGPTATRTVTVPDANWTAVQKIASGQTAMPTGSLAANSCSASATTATATGALTTDAMEINYASDPTGATGYGGGTSGGISIRYWITADTMNFKLCNETGSSITPGALSVNWRITR